MRRLLLTLFVLCLAAPAAAQAGQLRAGVGMADITPENGGTTLGFVRPDVTVAGVHTRLMGRVLVLDDGDTQVALLSTDLAFPHQKNSLVARVEDLGFTHGTILYTGTHTHSGPEDLSDWQVEQLARAIRHAHATRVPVRAAWGARRVDDVNRNRSIEAHLANHGIEQFYGQGHETDDPEGAEHARDTRLRLLRVDRLDGEPLAGWIHFPVHLTTSAPDVDIWDTDLSGAATHHLEQWVDSEGFTALYTNGALGDLMPRFDSYNRTATMDLHGRRIAFKAAKAWRAAGRRLSPELDVAARWTRSCYCGQEVEPSRRVSADPFWGAAFFGGSEDGASIFHEAGSTEGKRLPEAAAHPVHGRKIIAAPVLVHERVPEVQIVRWHRARPSGWGRSPTWSGPRTSAPATDALPAPSARASSRPSPRVPRMASAVVTGAGRGIGREVALRLAARGYDVLVTDLDEAGAQATAAAAGDRAWAMPQDVRDPESHRAVARAAAERGPLEVWVNNAGVLRTEKVWEHSDADVRLMTEANLMGVFWGARAAVEAMGGAGGHIINLASMSAFGPVPGLAVYGATKHGVLGFTESLQGDLEDSGIPIRVHAVCPDGVDTRMVRDRIDDPEAAIIFSGGKKLLQPGEVADKIVELLDSTAIVLTIPRSRAGLARFAGRYPRIGLRTLALFKWVGERNRRKAVGS